MNKNIEVEGGEIAILNSHGDLAIIPKDKRNWVKQKLSEGCHICIDSLVETLPVASQYAQDGSVYPPNTKVKVNHNNQIKEYDISSPEYRDLYNSGKLMSYDKNTDTYSATPLKEITVTADAPQWLKYKRDYEKTNPKSNYINNYLTPFARSLGNTETNYPKRLDEEYEQKGLDYVSEQLVKNKPQGKLSRAEWLNQMTDKEEEIIKRNPKYQSSLWADTKRGLTSLVEQNPLQTFQNILNSSDYTIREKQEMLKDYIDHPVMSKLGDAAKILNPLSVPSKMVQSAYKDDYSFTDALKGKQNNAGIVEDIVTDPLNLVGIGLAGKLSKADKVIDATKTLNKTDDIVKSSASLVDDAAYPVTRTTPNSGYTFKTISPNKDKIAIHESNKYHDLMWVAKNDIDNFFINNKIDVSKLPESKLVGSEVGYDWILPEGITHDMLNEFARLHHGKPITQEMRNIAKAIKEANPNVKFNGTSHELHGIASNIHPEYLGKMGQGLSNVGKVGSKVLNKLDDAVNNINRIKFDDFKNDNEFFRVIVGDEAFDDIVQTQKIRTKQPSSVKNTPPNTINLDRRGSTAFPSFSKGSPSLSYANDNPNHYIIRTADESIKPSTSGRHGKGTTMFPTDKSGKHLTELDASKVQVYKHVGNGEYELVNTAKPIVSSVDDVGKQVPKQSWQMKELPGLHLKSTMSDGAISKIVEPKTGLVNVEQALGIISKESGGTDKVTLIKQGLGESIPKKMDYNEFRKITQDQLIPLEKQFATHSSGYGIDRLGYGKYKTVINERGNPILQPLKGKNLEPLENQTLILGNKSKFGRGSSAHGNPDETLGHAHFLRDAETPDVLTVTQIQSDAFQGTHRIMPKNTPNATALERQKKSLQRMEELQERNKSVLNKMKTEGVDEAGLSVQEYQIKQFEDIVKAQEQSNLFKKADIENFTQKQLLDKNHQERYIQELVDYAGKRGDVKKVRVPTSETAAKVQGYSKHNPMSSNFEYSDKYPKELNDLVKNVRSANRDNYDNAVKELNNYIKTNKPEFLYSSEHQTILKKYSEQPKTIKKLFGEEPKIVTDSKGNTWYEFDIPKKFKEGKGEIKAFTVTGAIGTGVGIQSQQQNKTEQ